MRGRLSIGMKFKKGKVQVWSMSNNSKESMRNRRSLLLNQGLKWEFAASWIYICGHDSGKEFRALTSFDLAHRDAERDPQTQHQC